jgi:hypothetical protein
MAMTSPSCDSAATAAFESTSANETSRHRPLLVTRRRRSASTCRPVPAAQLRHRSRGVIQGYLEPLLNGFFSSSALAHRTSAALSIDPITGRSAWPPLGPSRSEARVRVEGIRKCPKPKRPIVLHLAPWPPHVATIGQPISHNRSPKRAQPSSRRESRCCPRPGRMRQRSSRRADASTRAWVTRSRRTSRLECASRRDTSSGNAPLIAPGTLS